MAANPAIARTIDIVEKNLDDLLEETEEHVAPEKKNEFDRQIASLREAFNKAIIKSIASEVISQAEDEKINKNMCSIPISLNDYIESLSKQAKSHIGDNWEEIASKWHNIYANTEELSRRCELLSPSTPEQFVATIYWMAERGAEGDLILLQDTRKAPPAQVKDIDKLINLAEQRIVTRACRLHDPDKNLQIFLGLNDSDFVYSIGLTKWNSLLSSSKDADATEKLRSLKEKLEALFEREQIVPWLSTPNPSFNNKKPIEMILEGKIDNILQVLIRLEEGI